MTDAEAIARSLRQPAAFEDVFARHFAAIFRYLRRRVGPQLAEDLAAETFTRAFAARRTYDRTRPDARPWLFGIATNVLRGHWQHDLRAGAAPAADRAPDDAATSDGRLDAAAAVVERTAALRRLPAEQREVLLLVAAADARDLREFVVEHLASDAAVAHAQTSLVYEHVRGPGVLGV